MQIYLPIAEVSVNAILLLGIGGIIGALSGLFGVGGGFLLTPLLFFIGIPPAVSVATGANVIVASSISGVLAHLRRKTVDLRMGLALLCGGLAGAALGVRIFAALERIGQVDLQIAARFRDRRADMDVLVAAPVIVEICKQDEYGAAPRTLTDARLQFRKNLDVVFAKDTRLPGGQTAQVRFELLNVTNTPKFDTWASPHS